jgi:hypothetical protein
MNKKYQAPATAKELYEAPIAMTFVLQSHADMLVAFSLDGDIEDPFQGCGEWQTDGPSRGIFDEN